MRTFIAHLALHMKRAKADAITVLPRSRTLALLLGIDFQKLSATHKRNRISRNFKKHFFI